MLLGKVRSQCTTIVQMLEKEHLISLHRAIWKTASGRRHNIEKGCKSEEEGRLAIVKNILDNSRSISELLHLPEITTQIIKIYLKQQKICVPHSSGKEHLVKVILERWSSNEVSGMKGSMCKRSRVSESSTVKPNFHSKRSSCTSPSSKDNVANRESSNTSEALQLKLVRKEQQAKSSKSVTATCSIHTSAKASQTNSTSSPQKSSASRNRKPSFRQLLKKESAGKENPKKNFTRINKSKRANVLSSSKSKAFKNWLISMHDLSNRPRFCSRSHVRSRSKIPWKYFQPPGSRIGNPIDGDDECQAYQ